MYFCSWPQRQQQQHGFWGHEQKYIPLDKIQDITIEQNWLMGKFGIHKVVVETAGQGGPQTQPFSVTGMADPVQFRQALLRARLAVAPAPTAPELQVPASSEMLRVLQQIAANT